MRRSGCPSSNTRNCFRRSIGEVTDIVEKEMYTFDDRNGESLTLQARGHSQCRQGGYYQRPAAQPAPETVDDRARCSATKSHKKGVTGSSISSTSRRLVLKARMWMRNSLLCVPACGGHSACPRLTLEINSLGTGRNPARTTAKTLVEYFSSVKNELDDDSIRRLEQNPLRILDSKNPDMQSRSLRRRRS